MAKRNLHAPAAKSTTVNIGGAIGQFHFGGFTVKRDEADPEFK